MVETDSSQKAANSRTSVWWRLQAIFLEPSTLFESFRTHPDVAVPLILTVVISFLAALFIFSQIDMREIVREQLEHSPATQDMTPEQIDETVASYSASRVAKLLQYAGPVIAGFVVILAIAGALFVGVLVGTGEVEFRKILAVTAYSYFAYALLVSTLTVIVVGLVPDPASINLQNPLYSNFGHLVDRDESPIQAKLLSSLDVFSVYLIFLLSLGISRVSRKALSLSGALFLTTVLYVIWIGLGVAWVAFVT